MELKEIQDEIKRMDQNADGDAFDAAVFLVASVYHDHNADSLARFAGIPRSKAREFARNARKNNIWTPDGCVMASDWADPETGGIGFWCDVACVEGMLQRTNPGERHDVAAD